MELNKIQSSGSWGKAADDLNQNFSKVNNAVEQVKNATTRNKGYFSSDTELKSAFPSANVGDIAYVGSAYPYQTWAWDGSAWKKKNDAGGEESVNLGDYYTKVETDEKLAETDGKLSELGQEIKESQGYTDKDFSIDDEEGNSIVEFSNGHIRTKDFDSSATKKMTQYPYKDCINAFVGMMNKFVYDYGMKNTLFVNASGMGTYRDEELEGDKNTTTSKDFMRLAACATQTDIMKYWNIQDYSVEVGGINARTITGTCKYSTSEIIQNAGYHIIGGKTGSWTKQGELTNNITLVVKSKVNDDWLVGTIMKADTSIDRDIPIKDLFDWLEVKRQDSSTPDPTLQCEYACAGVVSKNNPIGLRLYDFSVVEKNSETSCLPASMTKIMTGIVALHFCKGNEILTVEETDMRSGSGDEVFVGDEFSLWDALVVMHLSSSNTLATAVSRFVGNIILNNK